MVRTWFPCHCSQCLVLIGVVNVAPVQGLIHAEQVRRWRRAAAVLCSVGWRVDPQLFNIHDLHTLCDYQAAQTATAQAASTN